MASEWGRDPDVEWGYPVDPVREHRHREPLFRGIPSPYGDSIEPKVSSITC